MSYLNNYLSKQIKDFDNKTLTTEITSLIIKTLNYTNRTVKNQNETIKDFIEDMKAYHSITMDEIKQALRNGMTGSYGDITDISNLVLFKWVSNYMNNTDRKNAIELYEKRNGSVKEEISEEEAERRNKACIIDKFYSLKKGEVTFIYDFQGLIYDRLSSSGHELIDYNNFIEDAKKMRIEDEKKKKAQSLTAMREINRLLKSIEGNEDAVTKFTAKSLSVNEYFGNIETLEL